MWFLPCLFVIEAAFFFLRRNIRSDVLLLAVTGACFVLGSLLSGAAPFPASFRLPVRLPWLLDTALLGILFYALGYVCGNIGFFAPRGGKGVASLVALGLAGLGCVGVSWCFPYQTELSLFIIPPAPVFLLGALAGIIAVLALARRLHAAWLAGLGRISLIVMCLNEPVKRVVLKISSSLSGIEVADLRAGIPASLCMTALTLGVCVLLALGIDRCVAPLLKKLKHIRG